MSGYNTQVNRKGTSFHVQTQDKGVGANYVESIIYKSGQVVSSKRTFYTSYLNSPELKQKIKNIIENQHKSLIEEINEGKFDHF